MSNVGTVAFTLKELICNFAGTATKSLSLCRIVTATCRQDLAVTLLHYPLPSFWKKWTWDGLIHKNKSYKFYSPVGGNSNYRWFHWPKRRQWGNSSSAWPLRLGPTPKTSGAPWGTCDIACTKQCSGDAPFYYNQARTQGGGVTGDQSSGLGSPRKVEVRHDSADGQGGPVSSGFTNPVCAPDYSS